MKKHFFIYIFFTLIIFLYCDDSLAQYEDYLAETRISKPSILTLKEVKVYGATVISDLEIDKIIAQYLNRNLTIEVLSSISQDLRDLYISKGYITSGAFFPEQDLSQGIAVVRVIEGSLEEVNVVGLKHLSDNYLLSRFSNDNSILNINELENSIVLLSQNPLIKTIDAKLIAGSDVGKSKLLLSVTEASVWLSNLSFNNYNSANNGELQGTINISNQNLLGLGDLIQASYSISLGFDSVFISYELPLSSLDNSLRFQYNSGASEITASIFADFGIRSDAESFLLEYTQPIVKSLDREIELFFTFDRRTSNTFINNNIPFSFIEGPDEGESKATVLRLGAFWTERSSKSVISANMRFNLGLDFLEVTKNSDDLPDAIFFSWLGQLQFARAINTERDVLLITRLIAQFTPDSLLPFEQISLGGSNTIRGYRENREIGDKAVIAQIEAQFPLLRDSRVGNFKLVPFVDVGTVWNNNGDNAATLASLGVGLDWELNNWLRFDLDYGIPLIEDDADFDDDSLQGNGIHFQLQVLPF